MERQLYNFKRRKKKEEGYDCHKTKSLRVDNAPSVERRWLGAPAVHLKEEELLYEVITLPNGLN